MIFFDDIIVFIYMLFLKKRHWWGTV